MILELVSTIRAKSKMGRRDQLRGCNFAGFRIRPARDSVAASVSLSQMDCNLRSATKDDLDRINEIYNAYIVDSHTSFDTEPWPMDARARWFEKYRAPRGRHQALVATDRDLVVGFASSSPFRPKVAYDTSVETTVVLQHDATGKGVGTSLLAELLARLRVEDVHRAYAMIALPNEPSVRAHEKLGYRTTGVLDEVGHKLDQYHSVQLMEYRF